MTNEIPQFFLNRERRRLFGVLHEADAPARRGFGVVCCAPLFEEKLWSHRVLVNLARFLAARGIGTLRFDYFGDGESEGRFEEASVLSRVADTLDAVERCRAQTNVEHVYVLGLRYGATLALSTAMQNTSVAGVVAWAPVIDGDRYLNDILRAHLTAQMVVYRKVIHDREALIGQLGAGRTVNVEGYEISGQLYEQMRAIKVPDLVRGASKPVLIQQIGPSDSLDHSYVELAGFGNPAVAVQPIRESKFWTQQRSIYPPCEELFTRTATWLLDSAQGA